MRQGFKTVLTAQAPQPPIGVIGEASNVDVIKPDIVLLNIRLPDGSGFDACNSILKRNLQVHILILSSFTNDDCVYDAITSGAQG